MLTTDRPPTKPAEMTLQEAKEVTQAIKDNFDSLGAMLMQARDRRAYKTLGYKSFEGYCNSEFGKSVSRAYQLIEDHKLIQQLSAKISERLEEQVTIKIPSSYLKPLKILDNTDQQVDAIEYANHIAVKEKRKTTKADLELATYKISGRKPEDFKRAIEARGYKRGVQVELISTKNRGVITKVDNKGKIFFRSNSSSSAGIPYDQPDLRILDPSEYPKFPTTENVKNGVKVRIFSRNYEGKEGVIFNNKPGKIATVQMPDGALIHLPYAELECADDIDGNNYPDTTINVSAVDIRESIKDQSLKNLSDENHSLRQKIILLEEQNKELCDRLLAAEKPGRAVGISFGKTLEELLNGRKTQTRRSWQDNYAKNFIRYWEERTEIPALDKQRQYGGKQVGQIKLIEKPYQQLLSEMPLSDLKKEGGMCATVQEFIDTFFEGKDQLVWVLSFQFISSDEKLTIAKLTEDRDNLLIEIASLQDRFHKFTEKELIPLDEEKRKYEIALKDTEQELRASQIALMSRRASVREKLLEEQLEEAKRAIEEMVAGLRGNDNHENNSATKNPVDAAPDAIDFSKSTEVGPEIDDPISWAKEVINQVEDFCPGQFLSLPISATTTITTFEETFSEEVLKQVSDKKNKLIEQLKEINATEKPTNFDDRKALEKKAIRISNSIENLDQFLCFRVGEEVTQKNKEIRGKITGVAISPGVMPTIFVMWGDSITATPESPSNLKGEDW